MMLLTAVNVSERRAWRAFKAVIQNFSSKGHSPNYSEYNDELFEAYKEIKFNIPLKIHFLFTLKTFSSVLGR